MHEKFNLLNFSSPASSSLSAAVRSRKKGKTMMKTVNFECEKTS